jgi:hypothetical protein
MDSPSIAARPDVTVATTQPRVTPTPARGAFKQVLAQSLVRGAETAMKMLPGSPLMAVAIRGGNGPGPALGVPMTGVGAPLGAGGSPEGPGGTRMRSGVLGPVTPAMGGASGGVASATGAMGATGPGGTGQPGAEGSGLESSLQQSQEMNLYYLQIQEAVNAQNRSFTALSNVLKAEHDTVKTAIGNIR